MSADLLRQAYTSTRTILASVNESNLSQPTPCASWDVQGLVEHIVGGTFYFARTAEDGAPPPFEELAKEFTGNLMDDFDRGVHRAVAAFRAPGVAESVLQSPFGPMPGAAFAATASVDVFTHTWDLARALGQSTDLDPTLAATILGIAQAGIPDAIRGPEPAPFGPKVEVPSSAPAADQLAGFLGRTV